MSKPFTLIGLTGLAATGKDTVADLLTTHAGFTKMAFSNALYVEISDAFSISVQMLQRRETKEHPMTALALRVCADDGFVGRMMRVHYEQHQVFDLDQPRSPRQILQWWGTEYRRHSNPSHWTAKIAAGIDYLSRQRLATRIIVTDVRFPNEAELVRARGGHIWQIKRAGIEAPEGAHESETEGNAFAPDATLHNDHDIRHLQQLVLGEFWAHDAGLESVKVEIQV